VHHNRLRYEIHSFLLLRFQLLEHLNYLKLNHKLNLKVLDMLHCKILID
jgi:hypothetical protein